MNCRKCTREDRARLLQKQQKRMNLEESKDYERHQDKNKNDSDTQQIPQIFSIKILQRAKQKLI